MIGRLHHIARVACAALAGAAALTALPAAAQDGALDGVAEEMAAQAQAIIAAAEGPNPIANLQGVNPPEVLRHGLDSVERTDWSYWPRSREGWPLGRMNARQRMAVQEMLTTLLSARGYLQVSAIMSLEPVLAAIETVGFMRGEEYYWLTIYGDPAADSAWGWSFEGHHISLNVTVTPEGISATPSFFGSNPMVIQTGSRAGFEALRYERMAGFALLDSLDEGQRAQAIISDAAPNDILSGSLNAPDPDAWKETLDEAGVAAADMSDAQRALLSDLIEQVLGRYRPEIANAARAAMELDSLSFAWMGPAEVGAPYYFRITGGDFVYEFDAAQDNGNHAHTVWRDKSDDFGATILARHYAGGGH